MIDDLLHVKQIAAVLFRERKELDLALPDLEALFSPVEHIGSFYPFVETNYYEAEMGENLQRCIISFEQLIHPRTLVASKLATKQLEDRLSSEGNRRVNIDIGYLDLFKVVLASFKGRSNKIYLSESVWADMICYFDEGSYKTFVWGFPDFKSGIYNEDLIKIRSNYKQQLKQLRKQKQRKG